MLNVINNVKDRELNPNKTYWLINNWSKQKSKIKAGLYSLDKRKVFGLVSPTYEGVKPNICIYILFKRKIKVVNLWNTKHD